MKQNSLQTKLDLAGMKIEFYFLVRIFCSLWDRSFAKPNRTEIRCLCQQIYIYLVVVANVINKYYPVRVYRKTIFVPVRGFGPLT